MASVNTPDNITLSNNHKNPIISQVDLNNQIYDIHDDNAVHTLSDLASLGMDTTGIFVFKGTVATIADLPKTGNKVGYVYHVTANHSEYIWAKVDGGTSESWEEFGEHFVVSHTHNVPSTNVSGDIPSLTVSGSATGTPQLTKSDIKIAASANGTAVGANGTATFVKSYPGTFSNLETTSVNSAGSTVTASKVTSGSSKLVTTSLKGVSGTATVVSSVTPTTTNLTPTSIIGVSGSTTASKANAGTAVEVAKAGTAKSIPNVTGNTSVTASKVKTAGSNGTKGTAASWSASVTNGVLSFSWTTNTPTTPSTIPTFDSVTATNTTLGDAISVTPAVSNGSITPYTFDNVTVPKAATAVSVAGLAEATSIVTGVSTGTTTVATADNSFTTVATGTVQPTGTGATVITSLTATNVNAAGPATAVTVATGTLDAEGSGDAVMTGLGTASTGSALTGVKVTAQPTITLTANSNGVKTGETVSGANSTFTVSGSTAASNITNGKTTSTTTGQPQ